MQRYHPNAKLTARGRRALLDAVARGEPVTVACASYGVSRTTYRRWKSRYDAEGTAGLGDRSSAPRCPRMALDADRLEAVRQLRVGRGWGPDRIAIATGHARATIHRAIGRMGLSRTRSSRLPAARYERAGAGDLVHVDTKKLGRIEGGPGHRVTGDRRARTPGSGWTVLHAAVDDATRVAYAELLPDETGPTASGFLERAHAHFRSRGVSVERVLTDNGSPFVSRSWRDTCDRLDVRARRTRPYRPQTNGKVERWFQTVMRECLYAQVLHDEDERRVALDIFVEYYNRDRPHLGIKGLTPLARLATLSTTS